ncbi:MAG: hypothetical protein AMJ46_14060 [Latescibacteria bacterium DG_63]|nr:MAG: hypothetical protein AMJ46_14060 [Latescibacteria bacterium DG_63]
MIRLGKDHLLNKRQVADCLGVELYTMDAWVSQRRIPYIKLGRSVRFDPSEIEAWLEEKKVEPMSAPL